MASLKSREDWVWPLLASLHILHFCPDGAKKYGLVTPTLRHPCRYLNSLHISQITDLVFHIGIHVFSCTPLIPGLRFHLQIWQIVWKEGHHLVLLQKDLQVSALVREDAESIVQLHALFHTSPELLQSSNWGVQNNFLIRLIISLVPYSLFSGLQIILLSHQVESRRIKRRAQNSYRTLFLCAQHILAAAYLDPSHPEWKRRSKSKNLRKPVLLALWIMGIQIIPLNHQAVSGRIAWW